MAKRSIDGFDGEDSPTHDDSNDGVVKRRKIIFESVRLPAVCNVKDINARALYYKANRLVQQVKYKNMKIAELERDNERLKRRQETDEENCYKHHRIVIEMESQVYNAMRSEIDPVVKLEDDEDTLATSDLLQVDSEQVENYYSIQGKKIIRFFQSLVQSRQKQVDRQKMFSKKLTAFIENNPSTSDEATRELCSFNAQISEENTKLVHENSRLQREISAYRSKLRQKQDENEILLNRQEELTRELEDVKFEADKVMRLANKYESRLCTLAVEMKNAADNMATSTTVAPNSTTTTTVNNTARMNGSHSNGSPSIDSVGSKELEALRIERDEHMETSGRRLQEIHDLNAKVQKLSQEVVKYKSSESVIPNEKICNSEEYKNLKRYFSLAIKELEQKNKMYEDVVTERDRMRVVVHNRLAADRENHEKAQQKMMEVNEKTNLEYQQLRHDYDILRTEFEQNIVQNNHSLADAKQNDIRPIMSSLKTQNHVLKQEVAKYKKKWRDSVNHYSKTQREFDILKKKTDNSLVLSLDDFNRDDSIRTPEQNSEDGEYSKNEFNRLKSENDVMRKEMRAQGNIDRSEKQKFFEKELQINMSQKLAELDRLRKDNERYEMTEKALSDELESIGQALEELQEQNGVLINERRLKEDQVMKLLNERIVDRSKNKKLHEENDVLLKAKVAIESSSAILDYELQTLRSENDVHVKNMELKTLENSKLTIAMEHNRKKIQELGVSRDDWQIRYEKHDTQLKHVQELLMTKTGQLESVSNKKTRLEEENKDLRKKYERVQKSEKYGSTDAVLVEENRQLKEILTCPSCKTKQKDCIMLKCFHFFCESCIKARYDTRQRKCPKCNSGFGANDFHRVFL